MPGSLAARTPGLEVWLIEPWYAGSHRAWADGLAAHSRHRVRLLTHDGRLWRWRLRGAAVTLARQAEELVARHGRPDVVLTTNGIDVAAFLGLTRRTLGDVPVVVYCHESQLLLSEIWRDISAERRFPTTERRGSGSQEWAWRQWTSLAAADAVWFNSAYHRDALLAALPGFLDSVPDASHRALLDDVAERCRVVPVGVDLASVGPGHRPPRSGGPPVVLWNQRWDHDKDPAAVFRALRRLDEAGLDFRVVVTGENRRVDAREFGWLREHLGHRLDHAGELDRSGYVDALHRSDVVVSAARHEFFGIALVEAMAAGAVPVLPDALSYPEIVPAELHPAALYPAGGLGARLRQVLADPGAARVAVAGLATAMRRFDWSVVGPQYDAELTDLVASLG